MARRARLLEALQKVDLVRVPELAGALSVSEITIRRDLDDLRRNRAECDSGTAL